MTISRTMKDQLLKFRCRLVHKTGIFKHIHFDQDFEYVIGGHNYVSTAETELEKYLKEQFGWWPRRIERENMHSDKYWQIDLISIGDRGLKLARA